MTPSSSSDPSDLSSHLYRPGGPAAPEWWPRFVRLYAPVVRRWGERAGLQPDDADDLVQQVSLAVWRGIATFRREDGSFTAWVYSITHNRIADYFCRQGRQPQAVAGVDDVPAPTDDSSGSLPPADVLSPVLRRALDLVRREFEEKTWQAFWLVVVEEKATSEAAEQLGLSRNAVRVAKCKVLKRLRQEVDLGDAGTINS